MLKVLISREDPMVCRSPKVQQTRPSTRIKLNRQFLFSIFLYRKPGQKCFGVEHFEGKIPGAGIGFLGVRDLTSEIALLQGALPRKCSASWRLKTPRGVALLQGTLPPKQLCSEESYPGMALLQGNLPSNCFTLEDSTLKVLYSMGILP